MLPRIFGEDLFDDFFNDDFMMRPMRNTVPQMMKTDVRELDGAYELDMDLPGFKKEDIKVDLKDGTLTISAARTAVAAWGLLSSMATTAFSRPKIRISTSRPRRTRWGCSRSSRSSAVM